MPGSYTHRMIRLEYEGIAITRINLFIKKKKKKYYMERKEGKRTRSPEKSTILGHINSKPKRLENYQLHGSGRTRPRNFSYKRSG